MATARSDLEVRVQGRDELSPVLTNLDSKIIRWVGAVSASLAAIRIGAAPVVQAATFERELANVRKTTEFSKVEIRQLGDELLRLSTRLDVTAVDLAKIAAGAGQQGLGRFGVEGVLRFTESISRMASVLDLTAEEAAENVGKIVNIFKIPLTEIETVSSTINQISNNTTASGKDLLDVVKRIGDAAGSLNLQQASALAATGLDFGASPEVVGTAFANMFSRLRERAADFGKMLNTTADGFIDRLNENSMTAFKQVLDGFRSLKPQDQQEAIVKLFGGGRIGSLVNKLVQDTQNTVLDRALDQAAKGALGTSAIKEQETVLDTLAAQSRAAMNSLIKLGIDLAENSLKPLTEYAAQFNKTLQDPSTKATLQAVAGAIGDVVTTFIDWAKAIAALNINWENFVRVVTTFIQIRLAQAVGGALLTALTNTSNRLKSIANGAEAAVAATGKAGTASATAAAASAAGDARSAKAMALRILGIEEYIKKVNEAKAAKAALDAQEAKVLPARRNASAAFTASRDAQTADGKAQVERDAAVLAAQNQRKKLAKVEQDVVEEQQRLWNVMQGKMQAQEAKTAAARLAIEQDFQDKKKALLATGSRAGLTALTRERDQQLAVLEASNQRSLKATQAYYTRQAQIAATGAKATVNAERLALMNNLSNMDGKINAAAATAASAAAAKAASATATAALSQVTAQLTLMQRAAIAAQVAMGGLAAGMRAAGTVFATVGRIIASSFFWVTILYSIGDAFGLFNNLEGWLYKVTDAMGFTSAAARRKAVADKEAAEAAKKHAEELQELIEKTEKYMSLGQPGRVDDKQLSAVLTLVQQATDPVAQQLALAELDLLLKGIEERRKAANEAIAATAGETVRKAQEDIARNTAEIAKLTAENGMPQIEFGSGGMPLMQGVVDNTQRINELQEAVRKAQERIKTFVESGENGERMLSGLAESSKRVASEVAKMFTPETFEFAQANFQQYTELAKRVEDAAKAHQDLSAAQKRGNEGVSQEDVKESSKNFDNLKQQLADVKSNLLDLINEQMKRAKDLKLPDDVIASWAGLIALLNQAPQTTERVIGQAAAAVAAAGTGVLTGSNAPRAPGKTTGNREFDGSRGGESKARKEARARLELERAELKARADLRAEHDKQVLDAEQNAYDLGLRNIADYWKTRADIEQRAIGDDIADRREELKAIENELKNATEKAEQLRYRAQKVRVEGQIAVLEASRKGVEERTRRDQEAAQLAFNDRVRSEMNRLVEQGIISPDTLTAFQGNLDEMAASYRTFIEQLKSQGRGQLANSLLEGLSLDALRRTLQPLQSDLDAAFGNIARSFSRLQLAQEDGSITSNQYFLQYDRGVQQNIRGLEALIAQQERLMASFTGDRGSREYLRMAEAIDDARLRLQQFASEQDKVAKDFNKKTTDDLTTALANMEFSLKSVRETFLNFLLSIAKNVQATMAKALSESIMQSLGQTGKGGLGGFFQNIVQGPNSLAAKGLQRGNSPVTPMYVQEVKSFPGVGSGTGGDGGFLGQFEDLVKPEKEDPLKKPEGLMSNEGTQSFLSDLGGQLTGVVSDIGGTVSNVFSGLASTLSSLFSSLIAVMAGNSGSNIVGAVAGAAAAAHTGGVVGHTRTSRRVHPGVFANAVRYHGGGRAGLRPNEVPTILEEGETVRTKAQEALLQRQMETAAQAGGKQEIAIRNVLVADPEFVPSAMASAQGERTILAVLQKNKTAVRQMVR